MKNPEDGASQARSDGNTSAGQSPKRGSARWPKLLAAILLLLCIVGGGFFLLKGINSPSTTGNTGSTSASTPALPKPWCAAPPALSNGFAGTSISGLAENDVWSVGTQIMHWNGKNWSVVFNPTSQHDTFLSIVEIAPNDVWVVGESLSTGLPSHPLTLHWDGAHWQYVSAPDVAAGGKNALVAVSGIAANDVWAVGFFVPQRGSLGPIIEHWNGSKWSSVTQLNLSNSAQFASVKALAANDVWAVGYGYTISSNGKSMAEPVTEHWNGSKWSAVANPNLSAFGGGSFYHIDGSSSSDLWAVGSVQHGMLTEHWNGKSWSMIASPSVPPASSDSLAGVAASAPNNVWAVGRVGGTGAGFGAFIERWDGHQWIAVPDPGSNAGELDTVVRVGNQLWIVGLPRTSGGHAFIETLCP